MARYRCKQGGCKRGARWARSPLGEENLPAFLCPRHWQVLKTDSPMLALGYRPISLMPGEILGEHAVVQVEDLATSPAE